MTLVILARLTGRCADGAERDGGRLVHAVKSEGSFSVPQWGVALCGVKPGNLSNGWVEVDGPETPSCKRCARRAERTA